MTNLRCRGRRAPTNTAAFPANDTRGIDHVSRSYPAFAVTEIARSGIGRSFGKELLEQRMFFGRVDKRSELPTLVVFWCDLARPNFGIQIEKRAVGSEEGDSSPAFKKWDRVVLFLGRSIVARPVE